ncbi:MAG TPA: sialidase family protein [Pyrinomonadaceae bacterium]|nr:sialidase family protein [Pyrinomonadaceae bacterium]
MKRRAAACCVSLILLLLPGCARPGARESRAVRVSEEKTEAAEPAAALGDDGTVYVAWVEHRGREADVWLAHFDGEAKPLAQPARVNPNAGGATSWRGDPPTVAVARDGTVYVGWTARDDAAAQATTLYLSASRDGGRSFAPPSKVNDDAKPGVHGMHSLAVSGEGRVHLAWLDERNVEASKPSEGGPVQMHSESNREVFLASSGDGGRTFTPNLKVAGEVCPCCKTSLAAGEGGRVYVAWRQVLPGNFRHIAVASSGDGGETFSTPSVVSDDRWELQGCPVSGPALASGGGGSLRVLWYTAGGAGSPGLYWSESRDGGRTFTPRRALAETGVRGTPVLLKERGGAFKAVWEGVGDAKTSATLMADLGGDGRPPEPSTLASGGALPAAAAAGGRVFVAYVGEGGHAIWLARADAGGD